MIDNHQRFLQHLGDSHRAVWYVAQWLNQVKGYVVAIPPTTTAEIHDQWALHKDDGDLFITGKKFDNWHGINVKERKKLEFTGPDDFPFPDLMVCAKHAWDQAMMKPLCFINLSKDWGCAAIVWGNTSQHWYLNLKETKDRRYENYSQKTYMIDKAQVVFEKIDFERMAINE